MNSKKIFLKKKKRKQRRLNKLIDATKFIIKFDNNLVELKNVFKEFNLVLNGALSTLNCVGREFINTYQKNKESRVRTIFPDELKNQIIKFKDTEAFDNFIKEIQEIKGSPVIDTSKIGIDIGEPDSDFITFIVNSIVNTKEGKVTHDIT